MSLYITYASSSFALSQHDAKDLELKLNVTSKRILWKYIGDELFKFHTDMLVKDTVLNVTDEEYTFLKLLQRYSSWEECRHL